MDQHIFSNKNRDLPVNILIDNSISGYEDDTEDIKSNTKFQANGHNNRNDSFKDENQRLLVSYFNEVGKAPLLTRKDEILTSIIIRKLEKKTREIKIMLDKAGINSKSKDITIAPEKIQLLSSLMKGYSKKANVLREIFIKSNLRLVVSLAKKFIGSGVPFTDLIQEGNIGLIKAVGKFDPAKGYRFSTYASWWIIQRILRAVTGQTKLVTVPIGVLGEANKIMKTVVILEHKGVENPKDEEIAKGAGLSIKRLKNVIKTAQINMVYLDSPCSDRDDKGTSRLDCLADNRPSSDLKITKLTLNKKIEEVLSNLEIREQEILRMRFGVGYRDEFSLDEIGKRYGVSKERIRQIQEKALKKIRQSEEGQLLKDCI